MISTSAHGEERSSHVRRVEVENRHCTCHHQSPTNSPPQRGNQRVKLRVETCCGDDRCSTAHYSLLLHQTGASQKHVR